MCVWKITALSIDRAIRIRIRTRTRTYTHTQTHIHTHTHTHTNKQMLCKEKCTENLPMIFALQEGKTTKAKGKKKGFKISNNLQSPDSNLGGVLFASLVQSLIAAGPKDAPN